MINREQIIRMAEEAGADFEGCYWTATAVDLELFFQAAYSAGAADAKAEEHEACAQVCEEFGEWRDTSGVDCAAAIRARGETSSRGQA